MAVIIWKGTKTPNRMPKSINMCMHECSFVTCILQIRYRIGSPRQCVEWHLRICCAMPPSQLREHVDQLVHALQPFLPRFSSSFSLTSGCEIHAWPPPPPPPLPNVLLPCAFCWLIRFSCCWCCRCRCWWWCLCWCSLVCFSCCCCATTIVHKIHNSRLCEIKAEHMCQITN